MPSKSNNGTRDMLASIIFPSLLMADKAWRWQPGRSIEEVAYPVPIMKSPCVLQNQNTKQIRIRRCDLPFFSIVS